jgi:hypothetical protein
MSIKLPTGEIIPHESRQNHHSGDIRVNCSIEKSFLFSFPANIGSFGEE